jgi:hypothetical protein
MIITGPTGPEQPCTLFMCLEHLYVLSFFLGIHARLCILKPFEMYIYDFYFFYVSLWIFCVQKCIYICLIMIFLCVSKMPI